MAAQAWAASGARLSGWQGMLERLYEVETGFDVSKFLLTDRRFVQLMEGRRYRPAREKLLIHEIDGELNVSLYLDPELLRRLEAQPPEQLLDGRNLTDFWMALEGVSHFVYLGHNARYDRPVSRLEMELQAEVDKFVLANLFLARQQGHSPGKRLHRALFHQPHFHSQLSHEEARRYVRASRYAGRYCQHLIHGMRRPGRGPLSRELRRFYRLHRHRKLEYIDTAHSH
ncbi:hypothetical protein J2T60_000745 [Natronospira proteinivora]|uniref:Uncharacterized protein n=1 Tax=Natronospira proteinivora TaxID=1807133 RepID=A0ABT1G656_9GAMM|nr:hypothetical protein [Natronospira proteinivora]MCP1726780.1 hypothetical protein [Natronospira proteinivora]